MRNILILRGGALGDFIVTLPALALLRERWPEAKIELIGNATAAQLAARRTADGPETVRPGLCAGGLAAARAAPLLDAVHSQHEARWAALFSDAPLPPALAAWLGDFDLVVNYWPDPDGELRRRFPLRAGQVFLHAAAMPACAPAAKHYCEPLRQLGLEATRFWFPLGARFANPAGITIHPGSGSPRKNWPAENWRTLLAELPPPLSLILGEAEAALVGPALAAGARPADKRRPGNSTLAHATVLFNRPLEELVAHFSGCRLFLGHDSGISHLAAACGVPCVLLFGPTEPAVWAPPAPSVQVLRRCPDLTSISVAEVLRAAEAVLSDQT